MKYFLFLLLIILTPLSSQASLETRVGYGVNTFDDRYTGLELTDAATMNFDIILKLESLYGFGLGVRYETMTFDFNLNGAKVAEGEFTRIAALANYRLIDSKYYAGAIGTLGVQNTFESTSESDGTTNTDYDAKMNFSLGLEAGMHIGIFSFGLEAGKLFAIVDNPGAPEMGLNSTYAKVFIGLNFFRQPSFAAPARGTSRR